MPAAEQPGSREASGSETRERMEIETGREVDETALNYGKPDGGRDTRVRVWAQTADNLSTFRKDGKATALEINLRWRVRGEGHVLCLKASAMSPGLLIEIRFTF